MLTILGARPQFIKASAISEIINLKFKKKIQEILVHTGQHYDYDMSKIFFKEFNIKKPKYFLNISRLNHLEMVGKMIFKLNEVINKEKPDIILVYGDTNSTLAGAISSAKKNIPIAHIESGLRSNNLLMPEEINRIVTDRLSNLLFCSSDISKRNLLKENFTKMKGKKIYNFGDVMFDIHKKHSSILRQRMNFNNFYLTTIHREENCEKSILENILNNLENLSKTRKIIFPVHPRIQNFVKKKIKSNKIILTKPMGYKEFGKHIYNSFAVITDSGGVQKESFFFNKNCFVLRKETEWKELVNKKYNFLIDPNKNKFYKDILKKKFYKINNIYRPYGNGFSSIKIVKCLYDYFEQ